MQSLNTFFDPINRDLFFQKFKNQVFSRNDGIDTFEKNKYDELLGTPGLEFFKGSIKKEDIEKLVLPWHTGQREPNRDPDIVVKTGGKLFSLVIQDFINNYLPKDRFPKTVKKVLSLKKKFYQTDSQSFKANFIFISNDREVAHDSTHYDTTHGKDKLFIGNGFHRFVAYGISIEEFGFKPLEVYYVKKLLTSAKNP